MPDLSVLLTLPEHRMDIFRKQIPPSKSWPIYEFPALQLSAYHDPEFAWSEIDRYDLIILSSAFAVERLHDEMGTLLSSRIAVIGPSVKEAVERNGGEVLYQAQKHSLWNLCLEMLEKGILQNGQKVLLTSPVEHEEIYELLRKEGIIFRNLKLYAIQTNSHPKWFALENFLSSTSDTKIICLTSSAGVKSFRDLCACISPEIQLVCLGDSTLKTAQRLFGGHECIKSKENSYESMIKAIEDASYIQD